MVCPISEIREDWRGKVFDTNMRIGVASTKTQLNITGGTLWQQLRKLVGKDNLSQRVRENYTLDRRCEEHHLPLPCHHSYATLLLGGPFLILCHP